MSEVIIDWLKIIIPSAITIFVSVIIMWYKGLFTKMKESAQKEIIQTKKEASFEQVDAVSDILLTNTIEQVKMLLIDYKQTNIAITNLDKKQAVMETQLNNVIDTLREIRECQRKRREQEENRR